MKGDPGRQHLIPAPGESSFLGLVGVRGWEPWLLRASGEYPGSAVAQKARCGHSVVRRGQEQSQRPTCHMSKDCCCKSGRELLKAVQSGLGKHTLSGDRWPLSQVSCLYSPHPAPQTPPVFTCKLPAILSTAPERISLLATLKMKAIFPGLWRPLPTGTMALEVGSPLSHT